MSPQDRKTFDALFAPQTIALIGASGDAKKHTSRPQRMLRAHGYAGRIVPINPNRSEVLGEPAYPSLHEVPGKIDHAFIMLARDSVADAVEQCIARDVTVATIYTDGFAEAGADGARMQAEMVTSARQAGLRLLGPNCSGIYSTRPSCGLSVNSAIEQLDVRTGPLAIISQSGSMTGGLLSRGLGRGVGFSKIVSIGNECDISVGELVDWLVDDAETGAILLFLESLRSGSRPPSGSGRQTGARLQTGQI
jgi:acyl-CoA synthetase (NDP forming)